MELFLKDKKAIVTGATAGIGKAISLELAKQGASVVVVGTHQPRGEAVVQELLALYPQGAHLFQAVDMSIFTQVETAFSSVIESLGGVDILVNNAGITRDKLFLKMSEEDWDSVVDTNLKSVFNACKACIRPMLKAKKGRIVNISSVVGLIGNPGQVNYAASKSGMFGLTKSLAKELGSRGITVNCVAPGFIKTAMTDFFTEEQKKMLEEEIPLKRLGAPEEIAYMVAFLSSDQASYITGQTIAVDGGIGM